MFLHCLQTPAEETEPSSKGKGKGKGKGKPQDKGKGKGKGKGKATKCVLVAHASSPGNTVALHYLGVYTICMYMYIFNHVPITKYTSTCFI